MSVLSGRRIPPSLIYTATVDEDKAKLWDNKTLWKAVNAVTGTDMVDHLIP